MPTMTRRRNVTVLGTDPPESGGSVPRRRGDLPEALLPGHRPDDLGGLRRYLLVLGPATSLRGGHHGRVVEDRGRPEVLQRLVHDQRACVQPDFLADEVEPAVGDPGHDVRIGRLEVAAHVPWLRVTAEDGVV